MVTKRFTTAFLSLLVHLLSVGKHQQAVNKWFLNVCHCTTSVFISANKSTELKKIVKIKKTEKSHLSAKKSKIQQVLIDSKIEVF